MLHTSYNYPPPPSQVSHQSYERGEDIYTQVHISYSLVNREVSSREDCRVVVRREVRDVQSCGGRGVRRLSAEEGAVVVVVVEEEGGGGDVEVEDCGWGWGGGV